MCQLCISTRTRLLRHIVMTAQLPTEYFMLALIITPGQIGDQSNLYIKVVGTKLFRIKPNNASRHVNKKK